MPVCPNCHTEYRDGYTVCRDCGTVLIPDAPAASPDNPENKKSRKQSCDAAERYSGERFLANVNDAVELAYIKSALAQQHIPCVVLAEDISQYLYIRHGRSYLGVNIYVPKSEFEQARDVLVSLHIEPLNEELPEELRIPSDEENSSSLFRTSLWLFRLYYFIDVIIGAFFGMLIC